MPLSYSEVADIIKIIDASACEEVILELEGARLVVRRGGGTSQGSGGPPPTLPSAPTSTIDTPKSAAPTSAPAPKTNPSPSAPTALATEPSGNTIIRAPMVGTFYRRPSPDQPAFVEVGSKIKAGDPLCLIEVMKLYTTIESTVNGTISAIAAEEGNLVEFDQPLFIIQPDLSR